MPPDAYTQALNAAREELYALVEQQVQNAEHIGRLRQTITQLERLTGQAPTILRPDMGISQACREILEAVGEPLTPVELKQELQYSGYDIGRFNNVMSTIHSALKRLTRQGDIRLVDDAGTKKYRSPTARMLGGPSPEATLAIIDAMTKEKK